MKKMLPFLVGVFFTIAIFYACNVSKQLAEVEKVGFVCNNYLGKKPNEMEKQDVVDMVSNYYTNQYAALHDRNSSNRLRLPGCCPLDSRAVFFNLDTLKKLLYYIELASKNFTPKEKENLGVNIYFASYPKNFAKLHDNFDYTNRHTLIFIPSMFDKAKRTARDLNIAANIYNGSTTPSFIDSLFFTTGLTSKIIVAGPIKTSSSNGGAGGMNSQNDGTGTPPPPRAALENPLLNITDPN